MKHPEEVVAEAVRSVPVAQQSDWPEWVERWRSSGLSQREFCRRHGLAMATFNRRVKALLGESVPSCRASQPSVEAAGWLEVRLSPSGVRRMDESESLGEGFEVVLASRRRVRLGPQFDAEGLRRLLVVLEGLPC
jgi:hypothetical protein